MRRTDWLMLFLAAAPGDPLDPVRVQKGMFLFAMRAPVADHARYAFEPYAYGPMSRRLYRDVRRLQHEQTLEAVPIEDASWQLLALTRAGKAQATDLRRQAGQECPDALAHVDVIRDEIGGLSFAELLQHVYASHPEYATRSVFRRPR